MYTIDDAIEDMRYVICPSCKDYKGMTLPEDESGVPYCIFCDQAV